MSYGVPHHGRDRNYIFPSMRHFHCIRLTSHNARIASSCGMDVNAQGGSRRKAKEYELHGSQRPFSAIPPGGPGTIGMDADLKGIQERLQPLLEAEARARELQSRVPNAALFVGVAGITYDRDPFEFLPDFLSIRPVTNPPGIVHVCGAALPQGSDYLAVARYSHAIRAEITCSNRSLASKDLPKFLHDLAWHTAALIKLQGHHTLVCPGSATISWDTVASITDQSVPFVVLDDVPRQIYVDKSAPVSSAQLDWVREHWDRAIRLRDASESRRFGLAFNIAYTWNHTSDPRLAVANIWSGLDALFGIRTDRPVTQRLVARIASWLGDSRQDDIRELYNHRCDAVHGRWMDEAEIFKVIRQSQSLLRRSLIRAIERGERTRPDWGT
jgi:hypothetical protein